MNSAHANKENLVYQRVAIIALTLVVLISAFTMAGFNQRKKTAIDLPVDQLRLPEGFSVTLFAGNTPNARSLALGDKGTVFVGTRTAGKVYALADTNGDFIADTLYVIASGMNMPNGVAFRNGSLYVAEVNKIWRFDQIEDQLAHPPKPVLITRDLPGDTWHGWKYIAFGPDGELYVPVGAPCNVCNRKNEIYATILRMNPDGTNREIYARGVRNSVGFDWHPETGALWFTENGRDMMGDEIPHDELNEAATKGLHFGFPHCHAGLFPDPVFGKGVRCDSFTPPVQRLTPHAAALGMKFYTGNQFPETFRHAVFIAEHGSWNSSTPVGYRIATVTFGQGKLPVYAAFAEGWLTEGKPWGRPVDVLQLPDGSLLVSDDFADCIYRIAYSPPATPSR